MPSLDPALPAAVAALDGPEALTATRMVAGDILDRCGARPGVFAAVAALRGATERLEAALQLEAGADRRDLDHEQEAVRAAAGLQAAVEAAVADPGVAAVDGLGPALAAGLRAWQDPYADNATGAPALAALAAQVDGAPAAVAPALAGITDAIARMTAAGQARDDAEARRAVAVRARAQADAAWQEAAQAVAAAAGPGPWWEPARPVVAVAQARRTEAAAAEDRWFL